MSSYNKIESKAKYIHKHAAMAEVYKEQTMSELKCRNMKIPHDNSIRKWLCRPILTAVHNSTRNSLQARISLQCYNAATKYINMATADTMTSQVSGHPMYCQDRSFNSIPSTSTPHLDWGKRPPKGLYLSNIWGGDWIRRGTGCQNPTIMMTWRF